MSETEQRETQYILLTPENGFNLSFLSITKIAKVAKTSKHTIKDNVIWLLKALPLEDRILILERMLAQSKKRK